MHLRYMYGIKGAERAEKPLTAHSISPLARAAKERNRKI